MMDIIHYVFKIIDKGRRYIKKVIIILGCIILLMVLAIIIFPLIYTNEYYTYDEAEKKFARGKIITVDDKKIHYIEKGVGKPVIMIHGFLYNTNMWNKNIDDLSKKFKVYAIDLWGWGYSQRLQKDAYSFDLYSRQVIGFMDALKIPRASPMTFLWTPEFLNFPLLGSS